MREYNIRMSPVSFLAILEFQMEREINRHGKAVITGYIEDGQEEEYLKLFAADVWEKIEAVGRDGEAETLFWGIVTDFSVTAMNDQKKMTLEITTGSCLLDQEKHLRSYQDRDKTYEQIFRERTGEYADGGVIFNSSLRDETGELILQYQETDWEFLKRMAGRKHRFIVPESKVKGTKIFYDLPKGEEFPFPEGGKYTVGKDLTEYREKKKRGLPQTSEADCLVYTLHSREYHNIGDYMMIQGRKFCIYKVLSNYADGEMRHSCYMKLESGMNVIEVQPEEMAGCSLDAVVRKVKEDKVQIGILEDENKQQEINIWYPYATVYSTPDGTGWYCMPEPGDMVRLTVPGRREAEAFVISSVHMETDSTDRKDPNHKVFKSKYQKEVRFTPDSIVITNNQGTRIELADAEGIHIVSAHSVMLEAAEEMTISSDTGSLIVAGTSSVNLQQKGTSIRLDSGISFIGGELKVQ